MENIVSFFSSPYMVPLMLINVWVAVILTHSLTDGFKIGTFFIRKRKAILIGIAAVFVIEYLLRTFM